MRAVRFNVDGSYCLTCGADKKIKLWNPYKKLLLKTYGGHGNEVLDACGSCDSSQLVSSGADKTVIVWDVSTGQPVRRLRGHASHVTCIRYNEDSTVAVSGSRDNTVMFWDIRSKTYDPIQILREAKDSISSVQVTDHEILSASLDCRVRRYDIRMLKVLIDFIGEPVTCASFTRDGQCFIVSTTDSVVRLFDKSTGELLGEYTGHKTEDYCIESGIDYVDKHIVSGSVDGSLWWWELVQGNVVAKLEHSRAKPVTSFSIHPTQPTVISTAEGTVKLWSSMVEEDDEDDQT